MPLDDDVPRKMIDFDILCLQRQSLLQFLLQNRQVTFKLPYPCRELRSLKLRLMIDRVIARLRFVDEVRDGRGSGSGEIGWDSSCSGAAVS